MDYDLLKKQIKDITPEIMPKTGTAMGSAIAIGINRLNTSKSKSRIMILMTDGASNRGQIDPIMASRLAVELGMKIYCIGIGKKEFMMPGMFGAQKVTSDLDEESLKEIAAITAGEFFRSTDEKGLESIFARISSMEKTEVFEENQKDITDLYPYYLLIGFLCFGAAYVLMLAGMFNPLEE